PPPARSGCCATTAATATPVSKRPPWSRGGREPSATPKASNRPAHPGTRSPFQAGVAGCEKCLTFIGDYIGLDYGRDGKVNMAWTDMREFRTIEGVSGYAQHIAYARRCPHGSRKGRLSWGRPFPRLRRRAVGSRLHHGMRGTRELGRRHGLAFPRSVHCQHQSLRTGERSPHAQENNHRRSCHHRYGACPGRLARERWGGGTHVRPTHQGGGGPAPPRSDRPTKQELARKLLATKGLHLTPAARAFVARVAAGGERAAEPEGAEAPAKAGVAGAA